MPAHDSKNPEAGRSLPPIGPRAASPLADLSHGGSCHVNILYLHTHDTGRWISPYGFPVPTPRLEEFAARAVMFRNHHSVSPTCSPSRACLLTGTYPHQNGLIGLSHLGFSMRHPEWHAPHLFAKAGYHCVLAGIQHETSDKTETILGYHERLAKSDYDKDGVSRDKMTTAEACRFLRSPTAHEKPFFLSVGLFNTHRPFPSAGPDKAGLIRPPTGIPDAPQTREDMADYLASALVMDSCAGAVLDALREGGLDRSTVVFFTTDHGPAFPGMKCTLREDGTALTLIMDYPGNSKGGQIIDALTANIDVLPTLLDFAGIAHPSHLAGRSMLPLLDGSRTSIREELFLSINFHAIYQPERGIRTAKHKLLRHYEPGEAHTQNIDRGLTKSWMLEHGLAARTAPERELYDIELDPGETRNLITDPAYADLARDLGERLLKFMTETKDPLLGGPLHPPKGARLKSRTQL